MSIVQVDQLHCHWLPTGSSRRRKSKDVGSHANRSLFLWLAAIINTDVDRPPLSPSATRAVGVRTALIHAVGGGSWILVQQTFASQGGSRGGVRPGFLTGVTAASDLPHVIIWRRGLPFAAHFETCPSQHHANTFVHTAIDHPALVSRQRPCRVPYTQNPIRHGLRLGWAPRAPWPAVLASALCSPRTTLAL